MILFTGYKYVHRLAQERKEKQQAQTIFLLDENEESKQRYNNIFKKIISYFNVFFKETFEENDDDSFNYDKSVLVASAKGLEDKNYIEFDNIELYKAAGNANQGEKVNLTLTDEMRNGFFKVYDTATAASRLSSTIRDFKKYSSEINEKMKITLFHTHASEAFNEKSKNKYRSEDESLNIVGIGDIIAQNLENCGLNISHLKDYNDLPSYNLAYANAKKLIKENLDKSKKNLIIDLHRDGADASSSYEKILEAITRVKINDEYIATFSLVIGNKNKNIEDLKKIANIVKSMSDELYPGLCRGISLRDDAYFNQALGDYSLLIEMGSHLNSYDEVKITADFVSEILYNAILEINK
jgi:stage II sporulation protein P